jgi:hypothetical protein
MSSTSNAIYKYFDKTGEVAKCRLCKEQLSCKQSSTSSLWSHLKRKHFEEYKKLRPDSSKKEATANKVINFDERIRKYISLQQPKISAFVKIDPKLDAEEEVAKIMIRNNASFLFFDDPNLKVLFAKANQNLQVTILCNNHLNLKIKNLSLMVVSILRVLLFREWPKKFDYQ